MNRDTELLRELDRAGRRNREHVMLSLINTSRVARGLPRLKRGWLLTQYARFHARRQAKAGKIGHGDPGAWLEDHGGSWNWWGENVGSIPVQRGFDYKLHVAYMRSAPHRANVLGKFSHAGVGFAVSGNVVYNAVVFRR